MLPHEKLWEGDTVSLSVGGAKESDSLVEAPETVERQDEAVDGVGQDVDDKPSDELPLPFEKEDDRLESVGLR